MPGRRRALEHAHAVSDTGHGLYEGLRRPDAKDAAFVAPLDLNFAVRHGAADVG